MSMVYTVDPANTKIAFGPIIMTGFAENDKVKVELDEDDFKVATGVDGTITRKLNRKGTVTIRVYLQEGSPTNALLSTARIADISTGKGVAPFTIGNVGSTTLIEAPSAWIQKAPDFEEGADVKVREWVFKGAGVQKLYFIGGSLTVA